VQEKLEEWQDLKFGMLMHWGAYSQWGIVESWSLCPEDYGWCARNISIKDTALHIMWQCSVHLIVMRIFDHHRIGPAVA